MLTVIVAIVNALKENEAERRSAQKELEIACEVQVRLLPSQTRIIRVWTSVSSTSRLVKWVVTTMISFRTTQNVWALPSGVFPERESPALC